MTNLHILYKIYLCNQVRSHTLMCVYRELSTRACDGKKKQYCNFSVIFSKLKLLNHGVSKLNMFMHLFNQIPNIKLRMFIGFENNLKEHIIILKR